MFQKKSSGAGRTRDWNFIVYPESTPENWRDVIDEEHVQWFESPLHDKDVNPDGEPKKAHWHITIVYDGVKSYEQVKSLTDSINASFPVKCVSKRGSVRYMAHIDNPEKAQYSVSDIIGHCGADVSDMLKPTSSERYQLIKEMIEYIKSNDITEYQDLVDYAIEERFDDWFPALCDSCTYIINNYIKSCRHRFKPKCDPDTGEVIE